MRVARNASILALGGALAALLLTGAPARSAPPRLLPKSVDVRADAIAFFPSRALLAADGAVRVREGGRTIEADGLRFDLSSNRLLFGGHVRIAESTAPAYAAYHVELATGEAYALSLDPEPASFHISPAGETSPETAPEGVYDVVDTSGERPYIKSRHATVTAERQRALLSGRFPDGDAARRALPDVSLHVRHERELRHEFAPGHDVRSAVRPLRQRAHARRRAFPLR